MKHHLGNCACGCGTPISLDFNPPAARVGAQPTPRPTPSELHDLHTHPATASIEVAAKEQAIIKHMLKLTKANTSTSANTSQLCGLLDDLIQNNSIKAYGLSARLFETSHEASAMELVPGDRVATRDEQNAIVLLPCGCAYRKTCALKILASVNQEGTTPVVNNELHSATAANPVADNIIYGTTDGGITYRPIRRRDPHAALPSLPTSPAPTAVSRQPIYATIDDEDAPTLAPATTRLRMENLAYESGDARLRMDNEMYEGVNNLSPTDRIKLYAKTGQLRRPAAAAPYNRLRTRRAVPVDKAFAETSFDGEEV
jgi:hypothetical protein